MGDGKRLPTVDSYRKITKSNFLLAWDSKLQGYYTRKLQQNVNTVFARIICALFFSILAAEKSGCVKYAYFFCGGLDLGFILV